MDEYIKILVIDEKHVSFLEKEQADVQFQVIILLTEADDTCCYENIQAPIIFLHRNNNNELELAEKIIHATEVILDKSSTNKQKIVLYLHPELQNGKLYTFLSKEKNTVFLKNETHFTSEPAYSFEELIPSNEEMTLYSKQKLFQD